MAIEVRQLKDKGTGESFVPLTHWDAISNKPNVATQADLSTKADKSEVSALFPLILGAL